MAKREPKPTKKAIIECFKGVPSYLYWLYKDEADVICLEVNDAMLKNYGAAMQKLAEQFETVCDDRKTGKFHPNIYLITGLKK